MENIQTDLNKQEKNNQIIQDFFSPITELVSLGFDFLKRTSQSLGLIIPETIIDDIVIKAKKTFKENEFLTEKIIIPMITPLFPISNALKSMEESIGLIAQDPRIDESSEETKEPLIVKPQGFDNPNKLNPMS